LWCVGVSFLRGIYKVFLRDLNKICMKGNLYFQTKIKKVLYRITIGKIFTPIQVFLG